MKRLLLELMRSGRSLLLGIILMGVCGQSFAQVDVDRRRLLTFQTGMSVYHSEEGPNAFGFFWFNENHFPWDDTAFRFVYSITYLHTELSYFLPFHPSTAVGMGLDAGAFSGDITPYVQGERISSETFHGDTANARAFINQELPKVTLGPKIKLPLNVRATYIAEGYSYRDAANTRHFVLPDDYYTQTLRGEFRLGGIEPGMSSRRAVEAYMLGEAGFRTGFDAYGPKANLYPANSEYQRLLARLVAKIPIKETTWFLLLAGGTGRHLDELSAWRLGGNLVGAQEYSYTLHGYYTREFFARDFGIVNFAVSQQVIDSHKVTLHLYGDCAVEDSVKPDQTNWRTLPGAGAGVSFVSLWDVNVLMSYGYGFNAVRNGERGGHEVSVGFEKKF